MMPFLRKLLGLNWLLLAIMLALAIFGVVAIYSATSTRTDPFAADFWRKQANWVVVGFFAFMITSLIDYRWIRLGALPMYLAGIFFLILTKFMGTRVYGARSWLHLGPINFQPAQLAVVAGIMVLALFLTQFREIHPMLRLLLCGAIAAAPCLLILMQPDLGEVIIWIPVLLALLFVSGLPLRYLICVILIGIAFIPIAINLGLKPYQQQRITAFTHPDIFATVGAHSPTLHPDDGSLSFLGTGPEFAGKDPLSLARTLPIAVLSTLRIWLDVGQDDDWLPRATELHTALQDRGIAHAWSVLPGGHDYLYWTAHMDFPYIESNVNLLLDYHIVYIGVMVYLLVKQAGDKSMASWWVGSSRKTRV